MPWDTEYCEMQKTSYFTILAFFNISMYIYDNIDEIIQLPDILF